MYWYKAIGTINLFKQCKLAELKLTNFANCNIFVCLSDYNS